MYLEIVATTETKDLHKKLRKLLKEKDLFHVQKTTKKLDDSKFQFSVFITLLYRSDVHNYLDVCSSKLIFRGLQKEIGCIIFDKETLQSIETTQNLGSTTFEIKNSGIDYNSFPFLSYAWGWHETLKVWEDWDDLCRRIPLELQKDVFTSSICNLVYMDVEELHLKNKDREVFSFNVTDEPIFIDHFDFMNSFSKTNHVDMEAVRRYVENRYNAGIHINEICNKVTPTSYDHLFASGKSKFSKDIS